MKAAADLWLDSAGGEISETGIDFAMKNFGIELMPMDFLTESEKLQLFDLITFWGVIEHVPNPVDFLKKAVEKLSPKGMVIAEVPRQRRVRCGLNEWPRARWRKFGQSVCITPQGNGR